MSVKKDSPILGIHNLKFRFTLHFTSERVLAGLTQIEWLVGGFLTNGPHFLLRQSETSFKEAKKNRISTAGFVKVVSSLRINICSQK